VCAVSRTRPEPGGPLISPSPRCDSRGLFIWRRGRMTDRLDTRLTKFEENEIDKRKQLQVRVATIEKHLGLDKKIAA
jgi:hypothetical protein